MRILTCDQMKDAEHRSGDFGISLKRLMENAGSAAANFIRKSEEVFSKQCVILCGKGNNGGDGFVVARKLQQSGSIVSIVLADSAPRTELAVQMMEMVCELGIPVIDYTLEQDLAIAAVGKADILVDAIYGTGFRGVLPRRLEDLVTCVHNAHAKVYALDIVSGANANTGCVEGECIRADYTIAFDSLKPGHLIYPCHDYCGTVVAVNIGIPDEVTEAVKQTVYLTDIDMVRAALKKRKTDAHKGDFGWLINVCGSVGMSGAAVMATRAALRTGVGRVTLMSPRSVVSQPIPAIIEAMTVPLPEDTQGRISRAAGAHILDRLSHADCVLVGCGIGQSGDVTEVVEQIIEKSPCPIILDADGINAAAANIDKLQTAHSKIVITPHPGEMARLIGKSASLINQNRIGYASEFSQRYQVITVLKGANTIIALPDGRVFINPTGNPGMARGGSGDVLSGMIGALIAQGIDEAVAAVIGVYIHGAAGDLCARERSQISMLPSDLIDQGLPEFFLALGR